MLRLLIASLITLCLFLPNAFAQSCSGYPWTPLTNGNPADATQIMNNFDCVLSSPRFVGNVGVGTTNPAVPLDVSGQTFINHVSPGSPSDALTLNATGPNYAQFYDVGQTGSSGGIALGGANSVTGIPSSPVMFWNVNTGNVGIGTASPVVPLEVIGHTFMSSVVSGSPQDALTLNITGPNYAHFYDAGQTGSAGGLAIGGTNSVTSVPSSAIMFWNTNTGQIGIGTTLPLRTLDILSGTADTVAGNDAIRIATSGTSGHGAQMLLNSTSIISGHSWALLSAGSWIALVPVSS